jgi:hypothetical protein
MNFGGQREGEKRRVIYFFFFMHSVFDNNGRE